MSLGTKRLTSSMQRVKTKRTVIALIAILVVAGASIAAWVYFHQNNAQSQAKSKADSLVGALEARDIDKVVPLVGASSQNAGYYNQIAAQLGSDYKMVKNTIKESEDRVQYSFIYEAEKPRRPGTTFLRIIVEKDKDEFVVNSIFPNATEPSMFPS